MEKVKQFIWYGVKKMERYQNYLQIYVMKKYHPLGNISQNTPKGAGSVLDNMVPVDHIFIYIIWVAKDYQELYPYSVMNIDGVTQYFTDHDESLTYFAAYSPASDTMEWDGWSGRAVHKERGRRGLTSLRRIILFWLCI